MHKYREKKEIQRGLPSTLVRSEIFGVSETGIIAKLNNFNHMLSSIIPLSAELWCHCRTMSMAYT